MKFAILPELREYIELCTFSWNQVNSADMCINTVLRIGVGWYIMSSLLEFSCFWLFDFFTVFLIVQYWCAMSVSAVIFVFLPVQRYAIVGTAKRRITQTMPCDSRGTLVFWRQQSLVDGPPSPWNLCSELPISFSNTTILTNIHW